MSHFLGLWLVKRRNVTSSRRSFRWMSSTKATYLLHQEKIQIRKGWAESCHTRTWIELISNQIKSNRLFRQRQLNHKGMGEGVNGTRSHSAEPYSCLQAWVSTSIQIFILVTQSSSLIWALPSSAPVCFNWFLFHNLYCIRLEWKMSKIPPLHGHGNHTNYQKYQSLQSTQNKL